MKVFISADIEGTAVTATREGCRPGEFEYERSRKEMTAEVVAAAEGARAAGAELVVVKDAHGPGLNILPEELPEYVQLIRSWSGSPEMMVEGLDSSFPTEWSSKVVHQLPALPEPPSAPFAGFRSFLGGLLGGAG